MAQIAKRIRAAIYARVSTAEQNTDVQLVELRDYAKARGWTVNKEYVDAGYSGASQRRPALDQLINDCRRRKVDLVCVWKFDRFARSTRDLLNALEEFNSLGIQFISYTENIDTTSPLGQALFTIVGAIATLEKDLIRERVRAGLRHARLKGTRLGRPTGRTLSMCLQKKILAMRRDGSSFRQIAKELNVSTWAAFSICSEEQGVR